MTVTHVTAQDAVAGARTAARHLDRPLTQDEAKAYAHELSRLELRRLRRDTHDLSAALTKARDALSPEHPSRYFGTCLIGGLDRLHDAAIAALTTPPQET